MPNEFNIGQADMMAAVAVSRAVTNARRRPPRSRLDIAMVLCTYAASVVDDLDLAERIKFVANLKVIAERLIERVES